MEIIKKYVPYGDAIVRVNDYGELEILYPNEGYRLNLPYRLVKKKEEKMRIEFAKQNPFLAVSRKGKKLIIALIGIVGE